MEENKIIESTPSHFDRLGKEIKISPKSRISVNKAGARIEYVKETVQLTIEIGEEHTAMLIMPKDSWIALNKGSEPHIETTKEFEHKIKKHS